jgi:hypothetical protein
MLYIVMLYTKTFANWDSKKDTRYYVRKKQRVKLGIGSSTQNAATILQTRASYHNQTVTGEGEIIIKKRGCGFGPHEYICIHNSMHPTVPILSPNVDKRKETWLPRLVYHRVNVYTVRRKVLTSGPRGGDRVELQNVNDSSPSNKAGASLISYQRRCIPSSGSHSLVYTFWYS